MTRFGLKLMSELRSPRQLVDQAVAARDAGLAFAAISDHFHPWLPEHDHSPFAWSVLGAIAGATDGFDLATGVTCPTARYHPAIVAQAAATVACLTSGRFTLAVGSGERLNEHVTGQPYPSVDVRHEALVEAIGAMRELWAGGWVTRRGRHVVVEDARLYDLPDQPIDVVVAVSGPAALEVARTVGADGIMATDPDASLVDGWVAGGGARHATWTEVPFAWGPDRDEALALAHRRMRFGQLGWKVMSELPNPVNFDAASRLVRPEDVATAVPCGPDPEPYVEAVRSFTDAGFEHVAIIPVTDDLDGLLRFWQEEVAPELGASALVGGGR